MIGQYGRDKADGDYQPKIRISTQTDRGRWKKEEHELFLKGLELYGRDWKNIEQLVGSRTGPQIRSHAQKYFNRLNKDKTSSVDDTNSPQHKRSGNSTPTSMSQRRSLKSSNTTNLRIQKEEEKMTLNLNLCSSVASSTSINPLQSLEKEKEPTMSDFGNGGQTPTRKEHSRMYTEEEVLLLIKHIVKEFADIMNRFGTTNPLLQGGNLGMLDLNSVLLLSLMGGNQEQSGITSPTGNGLNPSSFNSMNLNSLSSIQNMDLSNLLKVQVPQPTAKRIEPESLLKIPKASSWINPNFQNLKLDCPMTPSLTIKRYDSLSGETKDDSDTYPSSGPELKSSFTRVCGKISESKPTE